MFHSNLRFSFPSFFYLDRYHIFLNHTFLVESVFLPCFLGLSFCSWSLSKACFLSFFFFLVFCNKFPPLVTLKLREHLYNWHLLLPSFSLNSWISNISHQHVFYSRFNYFLLDLHKQIIKLNKHSELANTLLLYLSSCLFSNVITHT